MLALAYRRLSHRVQTFKAKATLFQLKTRKNYKLFSNSRIDPLQKPLSTWNHMDNQRLHKQMQILYQLPEFHNQKQIRIELIKRLQGLGIKIAQTLSIFIQFIEENKEQIDKKLKEIELKSAQLKSQLDNIIAKMNEKIQKSQKQLNLSQLKALTQTLKFICEEILHQTPQTDFFNKLVYILQIQIKIGSAFTLFFECPEQPNVTNSHPQLYQNVWKNIELQRFDNAQTIHKKYKSVGQDLHSLSGALVAAEPYSNTGWFDLVFGLTLPLNLINYEWGILKSLQFFKAPTIQICRKYMNLYDYGIYKKIAQLSLPKIKTSTLIYIPINPIQKQTFDIWKQGQDTIPVRIIYDKDLPLHDSQCDFIEDIVIHMHGGGFIGLSSQVTQYYTRSWATGLNIPIFSVDYRMPPQHPFPVPPQDCLTVYKFMQLHIEKYLKIKPKNIYLCGDSAGGNLCCGLTVLLMQQGYKLPKGLFLAFPTLDVRMTYYPSRKYILNDPLMWPAIAEFFFTSYAKPDQRNNPIASPILFTKQHLGKKRDKSFPEKWPMTYIVVGSKDPLRDQSLLLIQKMTQSNVICKCVVYQNLRHAIYSTQGYLKQSKVALEHSLQTFKQLVVQSKRIEL